MNLREKFLAVEKDMGEVVLDRTDEIHSSMLALVSRRHMFLLGTPGVAKSMLVDELVRRIDARTFKWLLTKFSVPEEIFGGPDLMTLKNEGIYRRITDGKLPRAEIAFIDEIFKANSSILNSLLKILNENEFDNPGDDPAVPLITLFSASNEMPQSAELEALVDRLPIRHIVKELSDPELFVKMLALEEREPEAFITLEDIAEAQSQSGMVEIGDHIYQSMLELSQRLRNEGITVTDRRFRQSISIIKAEAWLNGRNIAEVVDTKPLIYVMWRDPSHFELVRKIVLDLADPLEREVLKLREELEKAYAEFNLVMSDNDNKHTRAQQAMQTYSYFKKARGEWRKLNDISKESGRDSKSLDSLKKRLKDVGPKILHEGMGIDDEDSDAIDIAIDKRSEGF
jgi:MoxR-like ATPase